MSRDKFLQGAFTLTLAGIVVKIIGSVNRILLSRLLGGEGIGLYQMAYPIYLLALSISSAGIPVAISIIVAEKVALHDFRGANRVFRISLTLLSITGLLFTFILYFAAGWLVEEHFVRDPRAYYAIAALAPAIFFVTILSSYRGYFQGLQMMTPTAVSQIFEQLVRVLMMVFLAFYLLPAGLEYAAAGASFGAGPGAFAGLSVLLYCYWRHRAVLKEQIAAQTVQKQEAGSRIIIRIISLALPISLANIMLPIVSSIDLLIVPARLEAAGYTVNQATELFGYLTGMAVALVNVPTILTGSLSASLVPAISEAFTLKDHRGIYRRVAMAMRFANLITIPSFVGMCLLATPISQMLYDTPNAGMPIAILSGGVIMLGIHQVTTGVLQGLGHTAIPLANMMIAAVVKMMMSWTLTAMPFLGIKGAAWATNVDFAMAALLNMYFVHRYIGFCIDRKETIITIAASVIMGGAVLVTYDVVMLNTFHNTIATLISVGVGAIVYSIALLLLGGIQQHDIEKLPKAGNKVAFFLRKIGILRK